MNLNIQLWVMQVRLFYFYIQMLMVSFIINRKNEVKVFNEDEV